MQFYFFLLALSPAAGLNLFAGRYRDETLIYDLYLDDTPLTPAVTIQEVMAATNEWNMLFPEPKLELNGLFYNMPCPDDSEMKVICFTPNVDYAAISLLYPYLEAEDKTGFAILINPAAASTPKMLYNLLLHELGHALLLDHDDKSNIMGNIVSKNAGGTYVPVYERKTLNDDDQNAIDAKWGKSKNTCSCSCACD